MSKKKVSDRDIEERYQSGAFRLTQERNDFLLPQIIEFVREKKWMNLSPEYQRRLVWDRKKRSLFIESLLMNIPIPPVFLFEWEYNRYEVTDGQQRLSSVIDFYENRFKLGGLEKWPELNGRTYADCPPVIQRGLDRRRISAVVLLAENLSFEVTKGDIRRIVFERLNTGGQNLNAQEIRNCLCSGTFSELLIKLAGDDLFDDIWEIPRHSDNIRGHHVSAVLAKNARYRRMRDCEIVLRFFAFRKKANIKGAVKNILDRSMREHMDASDSEIEKLRQLFLSRLKTCCDIFGNMTFRLVKETGRPQLSEPLYDATMIAIDRLFEQRESLVQNRKRIIKALTAALEDEQTYELIVAKPNTATAIRDRLDKVENILRSCV